MYADIHTDQNGKKGENKRKRKPGKERRNKKLRGEMVEKERKAASGSRQTS